MQSTTAIAFEKKAVLQMNGNIFYAGECIQHPDMVVFCNRFAQKLKFSVSKNHPVELTVQKNKK